MAAGDVTLANSKFWGSSRGAIGAPDQRTRRRLRRCLILPVMKAYRTRSGAVWRRGLPEQRQCAGGQRADRARGLRRGGDGSTAVGGLVEEKPLEGTRNLVMRPAGVCARWPCRFCGSADRGRDCRTFAPEHFAPIARSREIVVSLGSVTVSAVCPLRVRLRSSGRRMAGAAEALRRLLAAHQREQQEVAAKKARSRPHHMQVSA